MAWSKFQNDIFEYACNPNNSSFVVSAVAGSGKSSTLVECAKRLSATNPDKTILFLAFNKSIVDKLKSEVMCLGNMRCATLHSFGMATLMKSKMKFNLNEYKWSQYITKNYKKLIGLNSIEEKKECIYKRNCEILLNMCRINMIKSKDIAGISDIADKYGIRLVANEIEAVNKMLAKSCDLFPFKTKNGIDIDYIDMLYLPLSDAFRRFIGKYDVVFVDEAQDLSKVQHELMTSCIKSSGKFIAVGDKSQAINGFSGSDENSFKRLYEAAGKVSLPLSVNYRCGKRIIEEAQKIVPEIEACEFAGDGEVLHVRDLKSVKNGDMLICRKSAPLLSVTLKMMAKGMSAYVKGKDLAEELKNLLMTACDGNQGLSIDSIDNKLDRMIDKTRSELLDKGIKNPNSHPKLINVYDKVESLKVLKSVADCVQDIYDLLDKIFIDTIKGDAIMLSTVHKAKGLESDNVFILCPELLPMKFENQQQWEKEQEMNLKYVAITRAKNKLVWVDVSEREIEDIKI